MDEQDRWEEYVKDTGREEDTVRPGDGFSLIEYEKANGALTEQDLIEGLPVFGAVGAGKTRPAKRRRRKG